MNKTNHSEKKRFVDRLRRFAAPLTAICILLILALNLGLTALTQSNGLYVDLTPEGMYTLSDAMIEECSKIKADITITFCDDPDRLMNDFETRYVYSMAMRLDQKFDNISVETYNLTLNPTALDRFRSVSVTELTENTVIVSCGERYRTYTANAFWIKGEADANGERSYWSFDGEYVMATAFFSLSAIEQPVVYFTYGNGESIYVSEQDTAHAELLSYSSEEQAAFYDLLQKVGLKVDYLKLSEVDAIPEDCAALIINGATQDIDAGDRLSYEDIPDAEKLDRYISGGRGSVLIFKDPDHSLPNLEEFSEKWGISFVNGSTLRDKLQSLPDASGDRRAGETLLAEYNKDTDSGSYSIYEVLASLDTSPAVVVDRAGAIERTWRSDEIQVSGNQAASAWYSEFLLSSENAQPYDIAENAISGEAGVHTLAALSARQWMDSYTTEYDFSYVFGAATTALTTNEYLTSASYANYDVMFALMRFVSRVTEYADFNLGSTSFNSENAGGKRLQYCVMEAEDFTESITQKECSAFTSTALTVWTLVIAFVPVLVIPTVAAVISLKRRNR